MPVSFRIFPNRGLVYVRFDGYVLLDESLRAFGDYARHADFRPGQKHLLDLSGLTGYENDYVRLFAMQMRKAEILLEGAGQTLMAYFAPAPLGQGFATRVLRSWEVTDKVIAVIMQDEAHVLETLGQPETRLADFLSRAGEADA